MKNRQNYAIFALLIILWPIYTHLGLSNPQIPHFRKNSKKNACNYFLIY